MILPSDSCTNIHTVNSANNFTVSWEHPIDFSNAKVALTHMTIIENTPYQFAQYAISYGRESRNNYVEYSVTSDLKMEMIANVFPEDHYWKRHPANVKIIRNDDYHLEIKADRQFNISWKSRWFGTMQATLQDGQYVAVSERPIITPERFHIALEFIADHSEYANIALNINGNWRTIDDMIEEVKAKTGTLFKRFYVDVNTNRMVIEFNPDSDVDFLYMENGFDKLLGFDTHLLRQGNFHRAVRQHRFFYHAEQFNIYSSICEPMYVGNDRVPLLAAICHGKKRKGHITNIDIKNPMYINVHVSKINSIDINISNESFLPDTKVVLTLHFVYKHSPLMLIYNECNEQGQVKEGDYEDY